MRHFNNSFYPKTIGTKSFAFTLLMLCCGCCQMIAQKPETVINATFSGRVIDEATKDPLVGASIQIQGTTHGVTTDVDGYYYFQTGQFGI